MEDIWIPHKCEPDLRYCAYLMEHAVAEMEHDYDGFAEIMSSHRQTYKDAFAVLLDHLRSQGYPPFTDSIAPL